jgi:hypothetical protein
MRRSAESDEKRNLDHIVPNEYQRNPEIEFMVVYEIIADTLKQGKH